MIFKSLRVKLVAIYLLIVILFIVVLGAILAFNFKKHLTDMREKSIIECAEQIAKMYADNSLKVHDVNEGQTVPVLVTTAKDFDATIQIANADTRRLNYNIDSENITVYEKNELVNDEIYNTVYTKEEVYIKSDYFNEQMGENVLTVAYPLFYPNSDGKPPWAILIINSSLDSVNETYTKVINTLWLPAIGIFMAGFAMIYILVNNIVSRVRKLNNATQAVAKGRFDIALTVRGNDEISQLARDFNKMAEDLKVSDASKRDFVSNAAHELRSPMTSINGFVEGMLDGTIPPEKHKDYLEIVSSEVKRLTKLVKTMLDLSRIESGSDKISMTKVDINEVIRHVIIRLMQKIEQKGICPEIEISDDPLWVLADSDKIEQVLQNLIDNAIKFTDEGKHLFISTEKKGAKVFVKVKDEGAGINENDLKFIWDRFYTVDKARSGEKTGTGLGLSIVKSIIDQHGETISVKSTVNEGTEFIFTLQVAGE